MKRKCFALAAGWLLAGGVAFAGRGVSVTLGTWTDRQPFVGSNGATIHFYLFSPKAAAAGEKLPLVLWLHGGLKSNGRGGPNLPMAAFYRDDHQARHPCFVLRPVAVQGKNWVSPRGAGTASHKQPAEPAPSVATLMELLDKTVRAHPIDPNGLHVTGASMGGYGTWDVIARYPGRFATAIPICGGGDPGKAAAIQGMKIWAFHSADDRIVPPRGSREMFAALLAARDEKPLVKDDDKQTLSSSADGHVRYTEFKSGGHNAWDRALGDPKVIEWVFSKDKANENSAR
ncbi:MAG TPA: alpha/beta hydrolase-fold protein [Phycisphaerae bacterium]|nr:alpha/beta hydrolase-fold protein [Phycisphaerae bacterium]